ncbi:hypothetical protein GUITHDRAFT_132036 [Guillardia theta CCMP2712]|uniref:Uncharacterized protein n=1 Tax=Guillardia theta (strain CCMP2712) TaxID=905079 RepID=L1K1H4_GUITC|nr:hypothetical protein GUITHDRAFT_132036 [Guillardia theta CCMP2712]EKX54275.1 hypothetical protein GUITHDRAFT_132036 [Guillardia theta CCMP2712]|eukprot:XP_005841255.1 hypothetical protein GUITHDRAFT_132036 [Guillardia theta CCMP2712]
MTSTLLHHYREHPPDIQNFRKEREETANQVTENVSKQLMVPPPLSSNILKDANDFKAIRRKVSFVEDEIEVPRKGTRSLVSPLLWVPGVLRSKGPWATVMKETEEGESYILDSGLEWDHTNVFSKDEEVTKKKLLQEIRAKDRIIAELDETLKASQRSLDAIEMRTRNRQHKLQREINRARERDREQQLKETQRIIAPLKQQNELLKERYSTLKQAHQARIKNGFAQDTFSSKYNSAMMKVKEIARDLSKQEVQSLRNRISSLERKAKSDAEYILDLKQRLIAAAKAAEFRYGEAESKRCPGW